MKFLMILEQVGRGVCRRKGWEVGVAFGWNGSSEQYVVRDLEMGGDRGMQGVRE